MKDIPGIGITRGVFDIFVPGVFLLVHIVGVLAPSFAPGTDIGDMVTPFSSNPVLAAAAFVCFAYLIGMLLRLLKTGIPDRLSTCILRLSFRRSWRARVFLSGRFPYFSYLRHVAGTKLPPKAHQFYKKFWLPHSCKNDNRQFFNYCKAIVNAADARSGAEAYAAEATTRYVSSMFYALFTSMLLVCISAGCYRSWLLLGVAVVYAAAMLVILRNLRLLRYKEAEALFAATFYISTLSPSAPQFL